MRRVRKDPACEELSASLRIHTGWLSADGMKRPQVIAMGGGGFSMEPENPALDLYILAQTRKRTPAVCFLATATGDADGYVEKFYTAFKAHRCRVMCRSSAEHRI